MGMVVEPTLEVWDPTMNFESKVVGGDYTSQELDQEEHSFFRGWYEAYVGSDVDYDILSLGIADLNKEQPKFTGMALQALLVAYKDSVALEMVTAEMMKDHRVLLVYNENTQHLS